MIKINKAEVLRYLRYKNQSISIELDNIIDNVIKETYDYISPRYIYKVFDIDHIGEGTLIKGTDVVLKGKDINKHLINCSKCIFIAVTLGAGIERKIMAKQITSVNEALIMDACATVAIEEVCDNVELNICNDLNITKCYMNFRYSPGYGDFNIDFQPIFLNLLDTGREIGLYVTNSNILTPRKSVTAIIGILDKPKDENLNHKSKCDICENRERCVYRKNDK